MHVPYHFGYVQVNQIELHPWQRKEDIVEYCKKNDIAVMGYSPLTKGNLNCIKRTKDEV